MVRTKSSIALLFAIVCTASSISCFSQQRPALHFPKVTYGGINERVTTKEKVLADPKLICHEPNCEVTGFSFMVFRKDRDIIGPYFIKGARLTDQLISTLQALPKFRTSIFIDSIQVNYDGKKMQVPGISFQYEQ